MFAKHASGEIASSINPKLVKPQFSSNFDPQAALWITRLCTAYAGAFLELNEGLYSEEIRQMIGLAPRDGRFKRAEIRPLLNQRAEELAHKLQKHRKSFLLRNVEMLSELLHLNQLESEIIVFAALGEHHPFLNDIIDDIRLSSFDALIKLLAVALKTQESDIRKALRNDGPLSAKRLIVITGGETRNGLRISIPSALCSALLSEAENIEVLMTSFLEKAPPSALKSDAFAHLGTETALLSSYLAKAVSSQVCGVNVLIYGLPGTGKTEYVRWLAADLGRPLYQIRAASEQGEAISGADRLAFFQLSQSFLRNNSAIILFDEIEDVFPREDQLLALLGHRSKPTPGKMFINHILESNPIPTIWVSNAVSHIDKAYLRRFDFSFEMAVPPISVRRAILHKYLRGHKISGEVIERLSQQAELTPAQIEKATKVLKLSDNASGQRESTLLLVIENSQQLLEQEKSDGSLNLASCSYQLDFLNADCHLGDLVAQLKRAPDSTGALCFYGPPGTGKSALAHYIAQEINLPLLVRRASDILSPYVGETEQKIALMFKQAQQDGAVLLLDEADSFLYDRQSAKNSWELTAVNEMLTQMERFEGLFICSTNLIQRLDEATLRRFALKIKFDYLTAEQRWQLFLTQVGVKRAAKMHHYRNALNALSNLTPGDFATVRRQAGLLGVTLSADDLLKRLQQECRNKLHRSTRPIGFIHPQ